jgi:hypothetical protein
VHNLRDRFGLHIKEGAKPRLIYLQGDIKELCITHDIDELRILENVCIDWDMCCEKTVVAKMRTFVESIGYDWNRVINGQRGMEEWLT